MLEVGLDIRQMISDHSGFFLDGLQAASYRPGVPFMMGWNGIVLVEDYHPFSCIQAIASSPPQLELVLNPPQ
jgi:hypothetical protein